VTFKLFYVKNVSTVSTEPISEKIGNLIRSIEYISRTGAYVLKAIYIM
jgi:hypothetical protein